MNNLNSENKPSLLYRDSEEWKDVKPIYNNENEESVIRIAISEKFMDAFAYFRAIMSANELSERAFEITKTCIILNAANYSVWQYRRDILIALNKSIDDELKFCELSAMENLKNYQVWHHRRFLIELYGKKDGELEFTEKLLLLDQKNYHVWQYRQWLVKHFDLFSNEEIDFSTSCIIADLRNNSAWVYRYFIVSKLSNGFENKEMISKEISFTLNCIRKISSNESPWNYLYGLIEMNGLNSSEEVNNFCEERLAQNCSSIHLKNFCVDCLIEKIEKKENVNENIQKAHKILDSLKILDPIRCKYWKYRKIFIDNIVNF